MPKESSQSISSTSNSSAAAEDNSVPERRKNVKRLMHGIAIATLWSTVSSDVIAQETWLSPGTELRLSVVPSRDIRGTLVGWDTDTLRLQDPASGFVQALPTVGIERLRVSQPRTRGQGALRGLLWGSIIGALSLGTVVAISESSCSGWFCLGPGTGFLVGATLGGVGGGGVGAAVGAMSPGQRWEDTSLQP